MRKIRIGLLPQLVTLFLISILFTGAITFFTQRRLAAENVRYQTEKSGAVVARETALAVREFAASDWLLRYWHAHSEEMEIEYDADFLTGTQTREKMRILSERHPGLELRYADEQTLSALPEEDRKLCAEVAYSWLITRVNQIKSANGMTYLFCVLTDDACASQFFLFSAGDPELRRGREYLQVYTLGTVVDLADNPSQQRAMMHAREDDAHLEGEGNYLDYYALIGQLDGLDMFVGITYDVTGLRKAMEYDSLVGIISGIQYQIVLSLICIPLVYLFALHPLKRVQQSIRGYTRTKDSAAVLRELSFYRPHNEIGELRDDVITLTREIDDYLQRIETITAEKERSMAEISLAARIQSDMLPSTFPAVPDRTEFDIHAMMDPAREVGGDFYDFFMLDDDRLALVMADVSGKGIPAALFMMASMILVRNNMKSGLSPAAALEAINSQVCSGNSEQMFVTIWLGILDLNTGVLTAANAGHEYPVLREPGGTFRLIKDRHGFVVGGMEGVRYRDYTMEIRPGSALFLYTDGVPEATDAGGELFGTGRMLDALNESPDAAPREILDNVLKAVDRFVGEAPQFDDLTMLCLTYTGKGKNDMKELTLEARLDNIPKVTAWIDGLLESLDCPMKAQMQIDVALDEIFSIIARYAYTPAVGEASVRFDFDEADGMAAITFIDSGVAYNPLEAADPDTSLPAENRKIGGLGIFLVKKTMDGIDYRREDNRNIFTIRKKIR